MCGFFNQIRLRSPLETHEIVRNISQCLLWFYVAMHYFGLCQQLISPDNNILFN